MIGFVPVGFASWRRRVMQGPPSAAIAVAERVVPKARKKRPAASPRVTHGLPLRSPGYPERNVTKPAL